MRTHTSGFKEALTGIRQADNKILYTIDGVTKTLTADNIFRLEKTTNTDLMKSVMKTFEFESDIKFKTDVTFSLQSGLLVENSYEYLNYGNFMLKEPPEYDLNTKRYSYTCYDKMLLTMVDVKAIQGITFPLTIREYITAIATECGLTFAKSNSTFVNYDKQVLKNYYEEGQYTFRDILDALAPVIGGWFIINDSDQLDIKYPTETNEVFNNDYLLNINVDFNKKYGPINSLVLSRSAGSDNIYRQDQTSIDTYGLHELKINDNPFLSDTNRDDYIDDIFNKMKGLEFYIMDIETTGLMFLDIGDFFSFQLSNDYHALKSGTVKSGIAKARSLTSGSRKCIMMNDILDLTSGINEKTYTDEPELTETDYKTASLSDNDIKNAVLKVDKVNAQIELKVNKNEVISAINLSPEEITINANKIKLEGYTTINGKFSVDTDGNMTATGGKIGNFKIDQYTLVGGTGNSQVGMCSTSGVTVAFWAGSSTPSSAPFRVGHDGELASSKIKVTGGSVDIHKGDYYFTMGLTTENPSVSGLNVGGYGIKAYSGIVATQFGITDSDAGKSGTFILKHGTTSNVVYLTFTGGILTSYSIV